MSNRLVGKLAREGTATARRILADIVLGWGRGQEGQR